MPHSPLTIMIRSRSTAGTITSLYLRAEQVPAVKRQEGKKTSQVFMLIPPRAGHDLNNPFLY